MGDDDSSDSKSPKGQKAKRGRPATGGIRPGIEFGLATVVVEVFNQARTAGAKYQDAIEQAVDAARATLPDLKISKTTVKNILAEFMSEREDHESLRVAREPKDLDVGKGPMPSGVTYTIGLGPRPQHPRANRKDRVKKGDKLID